VFDLSPETWILLGRYLGAGLALGLGGIGAAVGMGIAAGQANEGIMRQSASQGTMLRTMLIGQALGGSPSIFALVIGLLILFLPFDPPDAMGGNLFAALAGAGLAMGFGALGSGVGCGFPAGAACDGIARNPRRSSQVTPAMIVGQAMAQSSSIFAIVIALILLFRRPEGTDWAQMGIMLGAGIAMGVSALGSGFGSGNTAGGAVRGLSHWPKSHGLTVRTMLIAQANCQTPAVFGMLVAFIMMFAMQDLTPNLEGFSRAIGAAIAVGFGGVGPGIGSGIVGSSGCEATAARPAKDSLILRTMLIGQGITQSTSIYALIIALALLFIV
jgi:F-type H+-transporting ATPase subunit c